MIIKRGVISGINEHGEATYPYEACGFVFGSLGDGGDDLGLSRYRAKNVRATEDQRRRFNIEPEEFLEAERLAESQGQGLLAIYHSHPDHPAFPSANDLKKALPFYRYLIVTVANGKAGELTCWRLANDRSGFKEEPVTIVE
jgi:proteasome lid subunit RPN8/RPN11